MSEHVGAVVKTRTGGDRLAVDWHWLWRQLGIALLVVVAIVPLLVWIRSGRFGLDFHWTMWRAGRDVLAGRSPYPAANAHALYVQTYVANRPPFVWPALLAVVAVPFALLPYPVALVLWTVICIAAFVAALRILGVRDGRLYVICLCSWPFVAATAYGQPSALLVLGAAVAWRYRDSWQGPVAIGALIAAKLLAWPLVLWLLVTRRVRGALFAACSALALLVVPWAAIGMKGLAGYPRLVAADAKSAESVAHSIVSLCLRLGVAAPAATWVAIVLAAAAALAVVRAARWSDLGWFTAALFFGLYSSPLVWPHYLVLLFVPLAIARPRLSRLWLLPLALWLSPWFAKPAVWQIGVELATALAIVLAIAYRAAGTTASGPSDA
jgi:alpha-1,2-mannosyltransferase